MADLALRETGSGAPPADDLARALELGLTEYEYGLIVTGLQRAPTVVELACFSLLWSEHCSYKHSRRLLSTLPTEGPAVVMGPGENAGAVDVGGGLVCAFKVESHNHPSAVEPFQGAGTGVGGILRDVFAVGARPIAVLDSLRFGEPDGEAGERSRYLLDHVVAGIGHYGNSIGVPTVGGEVYFEAPYEQNCLVNAMCVGLARREDLVRAAAAGPGNALILFGSATGRDGIGGASVLASAELGGDDAAKRPSVQIGDPFEEKKLLECSLDLLRRGLLVALQDLGAAGLTSAAGEMAGAGGVGVDVHVDRVPLREPGLQPYEIMVSESQERMLCVAAPENVDEVLSVCAHWETRATVIGEVTDRPGLRVLCDGAVVGDMPSSVLIDACPRYTLAPAPPRTPLYPAPVATLDGPREPSQLLLALLASPNVASRRPLFEQYDCVVQSRTVRRPEQADAAVLTLRPPGESDVPPGGGRAAGADGADGAGTAIPALAASIDCNGRRVACDPYQGTVETVLECAANLACVGAAPLGLTNCLNFANPEKPHIAWQLGEAVRGLGDACRALEVPVVGGNVSLYNESGAGPIYPTPVVGMVGLVPDARAAGRLGFVRAGDVIALLGPFAPALPASELAKLRGEQLPPGLASFDVGAVRDAHDAVRGAVRDGLIASAHDVAEGGLAVALAECCLAGQVGAGVAVAVEGDDDAALQRALFGEGPGGFVVSGSAEGIARLRAAHTAVPVTTIGEVGGDELCIDAGRGRLAVSLDALASAHGALRELL